MLSVIIPAYNEELMIQKTADTISSILINEKINHELLFIDDGSKDKTWVNIVLAGKKNSKIKGIHFSRNFGKEGAIAAGIDSAKGDCCVVIDCDLQHPPVKIVEMYRLWEQGYEIIEAKKSSRGNESKIHGFAAKMFYKIISKATGINMENASDFKLMDRKVMDALRNMHERNAFFRALSTWVGYRTTTVQFDVQEREAGESKWSTFSLVRYALRNISSFSAMPMQIVTMLGTVMFIISIIFGSVSLYQKVSGHALEGFTTIILIQLFSSSIIMISLGLIGYYIARIYEEVQGRPRYLVSETFGDSNER